MTIAAAIALMSAVLGLYAAALSHRFSLAPGWREQRWFALAALSVAIYAALDVSATVPAPVWVVVWCSRGEMLMAGLHAYAWIRYSDLHLGGRSGRLHAALSRLPLAVGLAALVPGVVFHDAVRSHVVASIGVTYQDVIPAPLGEVAFVVLLAVFVTLTGRYALAWRRGVPHAAVHCFALAYLSVMVTNDAMTASGVWSTPYLIDIGFLVPVGAVSYSLTTRFVNDSRALRDLRERLEDLVGVRTGELARTQEQLYRAEKLAALGQFAAGVAHEINNPAAVVAANLRYLVDDQEASGAFPGDARDCLVESIAATERIVVTVRQLVDAGRHSRTPVLAEPVRLARVVRETLNAAREGCGARVRLLGAVDDELHALAQEDMLKQVLANLVLNGVQAIPELRTDGLVEVRATRADGRVRLVVEDNGAGMPPEVLRRVFEPFFTTKPFGSGTGLGLAVSRGLVQAQGGDLGLEGRPGGGTRAVVDLAEAPGQPAGSSARRPGESASALRHVLLASDASEVLRAVPRILGAHHRVHFARGVEDVLARLAQESFDAVLCDVMMPGGGGERLQRVLGRRAPGQARRLVFISGETASPEATRYLASQHQPVLTRPVDTAALEAALHQIGMVPPEAADSSPT